ncbi:MAG TPA: response regulator transcription factor [Dehalococcoidia bacterium]|nr:response regulator transcription factor [Dehalococcoidia bacterium]
MLEPIKILIADDHPVVREGLFAMLSREHDFQVIGEVRDGVEAVNKAKELRPDIVLMDLRMPELDGVEAMRQIRSAEPDIKFIILTTYSDDEYIFRGIEAGARAYLLKDAPREELFKAIRAVHQGESLIQPAVASKVLERFAELSRQAHAPEVLSERELEVLKLMAKGAANKEIAAELSITESTVKTHITSIFQKLDVTDRTEAVTQALKKGIIHL